MCVYILLIGIITYIVESYGLYTIEVFAFLGINIFGIFVLFGLCYLHCVSALYVCRQSQVLVDKAPKTTVSLDRMKKELDDLVAKKGGIEHIESSSMYFYVYTTVCIYYMYCMYECMHEFCIYRIGFIILLFTC